MALTVVVMHQASFTHPSRARLLVTARSTKAMLRTPSSMPGTSSLSSAVLSVRRARHRRAEVAVDVCKRLDQALRMAHRQTKIGPGRR